MASRNSNILGFNVFSGSMEELLIRINEMRQQDLNASIFFVTAVRLTKARWFKKHKELLNSASLLIPQGRGIAWAAKILKNPLNEFFSPVDVAINLVRKTIEYKQTLFFLGSKPDVIQNAASTLRKSFPEIKIIGTHHGYYHHARENDIIAAIRKSAPSYLFVGLGYPRQERWIKNNQDQLPSTISLALGNTFELCAGVTDRGPQWIRRSGLDGLTKAIRNPLRIIRLPWLCVFVLTVFWNKIFRRNKRK